MKHYLRKCQQRKRKGKRFLENGVGALDEMNEDG
jgi:hypothetical protein